MFNLTWRKPHQIHIYTDGAIRTATGRTGLGVVVLNEDGRIVAWYAKTIGRITNNEAEYEAAIFALLQISNSRNTDITIYSDSKVMVDQVQGRSVARAPGLKERLLRMWVILSRMDGVTFRHIPRERNRLADALANDVVDGHITECMNHG